MIKKVFKGLLGLFVVGFGILNFSNANYKVYEVSLDKSVSQLNSNYSVGFLPKGRFLTEYLGTTKSVIGLNNQSLVWWGKNGRLYLFDNAGTVYGGVLQGFFNYYSSCDELTLNSTGVSNCTTPVTWSSEIISNFLNKIKLGDLVYISRDSSRLGCGGYCTYDYFTFNICYSSSEIGKSLCFKMDKSTGGTSPSHGTQYPLVNSQNLSGSINFGNLPYSFIGDSPGILNNSFENGSGSFDNTGNEQLLSENADTIINFFESRYGFNENICYVGTNDFVTEFGSGSLSFEEGTGGTVFSLFRNFYPSSQYPSVTLKDYAIFINVWQLNYSQWFFARNDPDNMYYLANWDGPGSNVKVYYDNLEFPFAGKPAVLYFMTDNIYSSSPEFQMGEEIVTYCFAKLNRDSLNNGTIDFDNYRNEVPGYVQDNVNSYTNYAITTNNGYLKPDIEGGEANMWNYIVSTGSGIPEDLQPSNLFVGFYNRITNLVKNFNPFANPLLPEWIIYPLIFLVLFRILKH